MRYCPEIKEDCKGKRCACYMIDETGKPFCTRLGVHFNEGSDEDDAPGEFFTGENVTGVVTWQQLLKSPL